MVAFPDVFIHDGMYYLFYAGSASVANQGFYYFVDDAQLGYAMSPNAISWTRQTVEEPLPLSYVNPAYPRVYYVNGRLHIWFTDRFETNLPAGGTAEPHRARSNASLVRELVRTGDDDLFAVLVQRYKERVFRLAASVLGPGHEGEAEDLVQEVFVLVYRKISPSGTTATSRRGCSG